MRRLILMSYSLLAIDIVNIEIQHNVNVNVSNVKLENRTLGSSCYEEWALLPRYLHWLGPAPRLEALSALLLPLRPLLRPRAAAGQDVVQVRALVVCSIVVIYTDSTNTVLPKSRGGISL